MGWVWFGFLALSLLSTLVFNLCLFVFVPFALIFLFLLPVLGLLNE